METFKKQVFEVFSGDYCRGVGEPFAIIASTDDDTQISSEMFYVFSNEGKRGKANVTGISCPKGLDFSANIEVFTKVEAKPRLEYLMYHRDIFPVADNDPKNFDRYPKVKLTKVDKEVLLQIRQLCPGFLEVVRNKTNNAELVKFLDTVFLVAVQKDFEYDFEYGNSGKP